MVFKELLGAKTSPCQDLGYPLDMDGKKNKRFLQVSELRICSEQGDSGRLFRR